MSDNKTTMQSILDIPFKEDFDRDEHTKLLTFALMQLYSYLGHSVVYDNKEQATELYGGAYALALSVFNPVHALEVFSLGANVDGDSVLDNFDPREIN